MVDLLKGYTPTDWFWIVGGDEARLWSSAAGAWVETLPEGAGFTRIANERELTDVLAPYGLLGPLPPDRVSGRQFKMQLQIAGLKEQVDGWIAAQGDLVQIAYDNSGTFVRGEAMMQAGFTALGFTDQQIDEFFAAAAAL